jgi:hypothetical protein
MKKEVPLITHQDEKSPQELSVFEPIDTTPVEGEYIAAGEECHKEKEKKVYEQQLNELWQERLIKGQQYLPSCNEIHGLLGAQSCPFC